jgi:hypothetical protein
MALLFVRGTIAKAFGLDAATRRSVMDANAMDAILLL